MAPRDGEPLTIVQLHHVETRQRPTNGRECLTDHRNPLTPDENLVPLKAPEAIRIPDWDRPDPLFR